MFSLPSGCHIPSGLLLGPQLPHTGEGAPRHVSETAPRPGAGSAGLGKGPRWPCRQANPRFPDSEEVFLKCFGQVDMSAGRDVREVVNHLFVNTLVWSLASLGHIVHKGVLSFGTLPFCYLIL